PKLLSAFDMMEEQGDNAFRLTKMSPRQTPTKRCCKNAFLRGAFLGAGSLSDPQKGYHLEIRTPKESFARNLIDVMKKSDFSPKTTVRTGEGLVYIKQSDQIIAFLAATGAHKSLFLMEDIRIQKSILNQINRSMNCDQHNMNKQLNAAQSQLSAIEKIQAHQPLSSLPFDLQAIATARLENPEASLSTLGDLLHPPIGKSGVNHRMNKLLLFAENITISKEEPL
ncbi:MAG: DNA-binding protein WhiA, partial [Clostridiales bacterium]|nr:DNA-binding protein WhiA [Clostridiales bacterium]